ncbi:MAG: hypothetical protein IPI88_14595 [Chitinophagaceae bacterium]|nr:hypothetical protein [Chitinophagaceae bacterium]
MQLKIFSFFLKNITLLALVLFLSQHTMAQKDNPAYDKALADSLGGDDYGMKQYTLVILKTGTAKIDSKETVDSLFKGHMENIQRMAAAGKLMVAGPIKKNDKTYRGIFILNVKTIEEANELLAKDPAIKEKLLEPELFQWYGSSALPMYLPFHNKVEKKKM